jgi:alkylation response protein AidB-like acyl-CoA dehydrogenase
MGIRASHTADLAFDDVRIPADHRLGPPEPSFRSGGRGALGTLTATRPWIGALAVGIGRGAFEFAAEYARDRTQFGEPVIANQGVAFMLADMDIALDAARLLTWRAGWLVSRNEPLHFEEASKAKAFAADTAMKVATDAVQVCGGVGFMRDLPVEKAMRDAKIFQIFEGTNQVQRVVIGRNIAQRAFR